MNALIAGFKNWVEAYFWVPASLGFIFLAAKLAYMLTGRAPDAEAADWIMGYAQRMVAAVFIILLVSIFKQATCWWPTRDQRLDHPFLSFFADLTALVAAVLFTYVLLH